MNLAIASPAAEKYSESFVRAQIRGLPHRLRVHGRPVALETRPGGRIAPLRTARGWIDIAHHMVWKRTGREGPQRAELERRMRRARVEVVLANFGPMGVRLLPTCRRLSLPLVVHFHGVDAHEKSVVERHREAYRELGCEAAAVVAVSRAMQAALEGIGIAREKIHLVRYGVDPTCFRPRSGPPPGPPVFVGFGRFVDKKAPHLTVLAFRKVRQRFPDARLLLAGDGLLLESTRNLVEGLGLDDAVEFPGVLGPERVSELMRGATAFVQHSVVPRLGPAEGDSEGTPISVLEAMSSGLPIVATRHAGIGEVLEDRRTGLLVEERDVDGMARAMMEVAASPELAASLGEAAAAEALEKYTVDRYITALKEVLVSARSASG